MSFRIASVLLGMLFAARAFAADPAILTAPDPQPRDGFGLVVAAHGNLVAVGAPGADTSIAQGFVHLYEFDGTQWRHAATLGSEEEATHEGFGLAIAMDAARVVVGAPRADLNGVTDTGAAYVFVRTAEGWRREARLTAADASPGAGFGTAVAIDGDALIVGANGRTDEFGPPLGVAYVFEHDDARGWQQHARLQPALYRNGLFGSEVAVSAGEAAVGAPNNGVDGKGTVMFYQRHDSGWFENGMASPELGGSMTSFAGARLAMEGQRLAISADSDQADPGDEQGRVYVYERDSTGWQKQAVLGAPESGGHGFGWAIAMAAERIAVTQANGGKVFLFRHDGDAWSHGNTLAPENFVSVSRRALALTAERLVVGSEGEVFVYPLAEADPANAPADEGNDVVLVVESPVEEKVSGGGGLAWLLILAGFMRRAPRVRAHLQ